MGRWGSIISYFNFITINSPPFKIEQVLLHNVSVNVMLNSPNLLHQFSKFVVPFHHYPQFKENLVQLCLVQNFFNRQPSHLS